MSDPAQKSDRPPRSGSTDRSDPNFTMPGLDQPAPQVPPRDAAMATGMGQNAPARDKLHTAARGTEHAAPPPSPNPGPKLWIIGSLVLVVVIGAIALA